MYTQWKVKMEDALPHLLKKTVLSKPPPTPPTPASKAQTPMPGDSRSTSRAADFSHIIPPRKIGSLLYGIYTYTISQHFKQTQGNTQYNYPRK